MISDLHQLIMFIDFLFLLLPLISVCQCNENNPQVKIPLGEVRGYKKTSFGGKTFSAFEGIPFAKAPIGDRRFEEPEPVEPWDGVWNANVPTECAQTAFFDATSTKGDEDCLHINVYVPRENPNPKEKLDIIVHIHGGAYMIGRGPVSTNPYYFMDREVILVSFNYRLGILGFLGTEDDVVPGNNGLKDQVLALKWIQENIAGFGGNPDSVTLTGLSAGGCSVHLHYFSPLSRGLFHRGFSQSGVALNSFSLQEEPLHKAKLLAQSVGCPTSTSRALVKCLKQRPYKHLLPKVTLFFGYMIFPVAPFAPVVEKGSKPFLSDYPYNLLLKAQVQDLPWIASNTQHEGSFPTAFLKNNLKEINDNWENFAAYLLDYNYTLSPSLWKSVAEKTKIFYLGENQEINEENFRKFLNMFSDRIFLVDAESAVRMQANATKSPVYYYYFSYPGDDNDDQIVGHASDRRYFFNKLNFKKLSPNEIKMKDLLLNMLVSFAKTGKPTLEGVNWEPTKYDQLTYMNITSFEPAHIKVETVKELTPRNFWKSLEFLENENLVSVKDEL